MQVRFYDHYAYKKIPTHLYSYQLLSFCYLDCGNGQRGGIDLVFVLDESGSIGARRFRLIRQFVAEISGVLDIGLQRSLVGVISFSTSVRLNFGITQHTDQNSLLSAISNLPYREGYTNTAAGLDLLRTAGQPGGALKLRDGFTHIAILITDGKSNRGNTGVAASALHDANIYSEIYAVGINQADIDELKLIASEPSLVFFDGDFDSAAIASLEQSVTKQLMPCIGKLSIAQELKLLFIIFSIDAVMGTVAGDPHFRVPLLSDDTLCYSIQGYPGLIFNLIYNDDFVINALFIDSIGDEKEVTWIGKLAVIPRHANKSDAVIFDSVNQEIILVDQGNFKASIIDTISYDASGKLSVKFTPGIAEQAGNPTVHVKYDKPLASFDVTFFSNHLDVNWDLKYDSVPKIHGLMGMLVSRYTTIILFIV